MFQDLDDTLKKLLDWDPAALTPPPPPPPPPPPLPAGLQTAAPPAVRHAQKLFLTPDKSFPPALLGQTTLDLFLHRIQENFELREGAGFLRYNENPVISPQPLLRVDCSYLMTAWSVQAGEPGVRQEHELLGLALQWLARFRTIPEAVLAGSLKPNLNDNIPLPYAMSANVDPNRIPVDFWTALQIAPRPSFDLTVTIAIDLAVTVDPGPLVTDRELDIKLIKPPGPPVLVSQRFSIGGTVFAANGTPLKDAMVGLNDKPRALDQKTKADGRFILKNLAAGTYLLRAAASGGSLPKLQQVDVPATSANAFDIHFTN